MCRKEPKLKIIEQNWNKYLSAIIIDSLYDTYPARAPLENSTQFFELQKITAQKKMDPFLPGLNRDAATQALYQLAGLGTSLGIAIFGGLLTGRWCLVKMFSQWL